MPLRKIRPPRVEALPVKDSDIEAVISKGGGLATAEPRKVKQQNYPLYFLQPDMRNRIDAVIRKGGGVKPKTVNVWINEAILDKLAKEE